MHNLLSENKYQKWLKKNFIIFWEKNNYSKATQEYQIVFKTMDKNYKSQLPNNHR